MKLIEFLISENKKGWQWPGTIAKATSTKGVRGVNFYFDYACPPSLSNTLIAPAPFSCSELVTRESYEAALAASKPEWDGDGLPPVGLPVELQFWNDGKTEMVRVIAYHGNEAWVEFTEDGRNTLIGNPEFRPIRSEADNKRDEAVKEFVRQLIECVDLHAMDKRQEDIVREKLYSILPMLPGVTVID